MKERSTFDMSFLELVEYYMDEYGLDEETACNEARAVSKTLGDFTSAESEWEPD
jgi:hypothetical protein